MGEREIGGWLVNGTLSKNDCFMKKRFFDRRTFGIAALDRVK